MKEFIINTFEIEDEYIWICCLFIVESAIQPF